MKTTQSYSLSDALHFLVYNYQILNSFFSLSMKVLMMLSIEHLNCCYQKTKKNFIFLMEGNVNLVWFYYLR